MIVLLPKDHDQLALDVATALETVILLAFA